ncbi:hypothetical protein Tco_1578714 [Tanacetum coccineum]
MIKTMGYDGTKEMDYSWADGVSSTASFLALDTTTLRELIDFEGRLILEDPALGVSHVAIPKGPRPSMQYLYDRMGSHGIRQKR